MAVNTFDMHSDWLITSPRFWCEICDYEFRHMAQHIQAHCSQWIRIEEDMVNFVYIFRDIKPFNYGSKLVIVLSLCPVQMLPRDNARWRHWKRHARRPISRHFRICVIRINSANQMKIVKTVDPINRLRGRVWRHPSFSVNRLTTFS